MRLIALRTKAIASLSLRAEREIRNAGVASGLSRFTAGRRKQGGRPLTPSALAFGGFATGQGDREFPPTQAGLVGHTRQSRVTLARHIHAIYAKISLPPRRFTRVSGFSKGFYDAAVKFVLATSSECQLFRDFHCGLAAACAIFSTRTIIAAAPSARHQRFFRYSAMWNFALAGHQNKNVYLISTSFMMIRCYIDCCHYIMTSSS